MQRPFRFPKLLRWLGLAQKAGTALFIGLSTVLSAHAADPSSRPAAEDSPVPVDTTHAWLLHVPGIAGECRIDQTLVSGIREGGFKGGSEIYDWTGVNKGIAALMNRERNDTEAQKIADKIVAQRKKDPEGRILLTGHSGGTGLIVFALEKLPKEISVDGVLLLSPALSPAYDLSKALTHVSGKLYCFSSTLDILVLGMGTKLFGTMDRKQGDSAGRIGFVMPESADTKQYEKLVSCPYEKAWMQFENIGDHVSVMSRSFSKHILSPLILSHLNVREPTTRPAATQPVLPTEKSIR